MPKILDYKNKIILLQKHHLKSSVITRLNKKRMNIYDIKIGDASLEDYGDFTKTPFLIECLAKAEANHFPVLLLVNCTTRLLIFNKAYDTH